MTSFTLRRATALIALAAGAIACSPGAAAAATASPTVRIDVSGTQACSGTLVAPRFVLTDKRCVTRGGRALAGSRLTVVGTRNRADRMGVAGITASRTSNLALVQLTSPPALPTVRLIAPSRSAVRSGRRGRLSGWASTRATRTVTATLVARSQCGTRASSALCARLARRTKVPARRCAEPGGAPLQLTVAGGRYVGALAVRSTRGCRSTPRVRFVKLSAAHLRWVASVVRASGTPVAVRTGTAGTTLVAGSGAAAGGGTGSAGGTGSGASGGPRAEDPPTPAPGMTAPGALAPYVGTWTGTVTERPRRTPTSYTATVTITRDGRVEEVVGSSAYQYSFSCGGELRYLGADGTGGVAFLERITSGGGCASGGRLGLALVSGKPAVTYTWSKDDRSFRADGVLQRAR